MSLPPNVMTVISLTTRPRIDPFSLFDVVFVLAFVHLARGEDHAAFAVKLRVAPVAFVEFAVVGDLSSAALVDV